MSNEPATADEAEEKLVSVLSSLTLGAELPEVRNISLLGGTVTFAACEDRVIVSLAKNGSHKTMEMGNTEAAAWIRSLLDGDRSASARCVMTGDSDQQQDAVT